jgi:hypothetical protein
MQIFVKNYTQILPRETAAMPRNVATSGFYKKLPF